MKKWFFLTITLFILYSCEPYSHSKFYDFVVKNELLSSVIKIVPMAASDFWLLSSDTIVVIPGEKVFIGLHFEYDDNKKIIDLYDSEDIIEYFDLYIDDVKSDIVFSERKYWTFEMGSVDESAIYLLTINEEVIALNN